MNNIIKTALTHAGLAIVIQIVVAFYLTQFHSMTANHAVLAGGFTACAGFLFREIAQHEYKGGGPLKVGILYGLTHHWTLDSVLDILFPIIFTGGLWILLKLV